MIPVAPKLLNEVGYSKHAVLVVDPCGTPRDQVAHLTFLCDRLMLMKRWVGMSGLIKVWMGEDGSWIDADIWMDRNGWIYTDVWMDGPMIVGFIVGVGDIYMEG